jgi:hypothetical protein
MPGTWASDAQGMGLGERYEPSFTNGWYGRHGSLRRLGQAGNAVGMRNFGTIGSTKLDGMLGENAIDSVAVPPAGSVCANDQTGCVPLGAEIVTLIREPGR